MIRGLVSNVDYMIDDSLKRLAKIVERHAQVSFLFLDSAVMHETARFADPSHEDPEYIDNWKKNF